MAPKRRGVKSRLSGKQPGLFVDIFSGTGCVSKAAGKQRYKVITVDKEARPGQYERKPRAQIDGDVHSQEVQKQLFALKPDVAWASVPCENVSRAKTTGTKRTLNQTRKNVALVKRLFAHWAKKKRFVGIVENPTGGLAKLGLMSKYHKHTVHYCMYHDATIDDFESEYKKATDIFTTRPTPFVAEKCSKENPCPFAFVNKKTGKLNHPQTAQAGPSSTNQVGTATLAERYHVPGRLVYALLSASHHAPASAK